MITQPTSNKNFYVSSKGFSVEILGWTGLMYCEADREMFINSERQVGGRIFTEIYAGYMSQWKPPHDSEPVTNEDRTRIIENIRELFKDLGYEIDVVA